MKVKCLPLALLLVLGLSQSLAPVMAYNYYNYSPYQFLYLGQGLLYPLTRGLFGPFYGGYNSNPLYMGNFFMRRNASYAQQYPNVYPYSPNQYSAYGYRSGGMPPDNSNNSGNNGSNSGNSSGNNTNNSNNSSSNSNNLNSNSNNAQPYGSNLQNNGGPFTLPGPQLAPGAQPYGFQSQSAPPAQSGGYSGYQPAGGADGFSAPAPPQGFGMANGASVPSGAASPLAESFINHVNNRFNGDMSKALSDTETRNWARSMGVVDDGVADGSHLTGDRLDVLGKILRDDSLDSVSKLDTMKILLKKKPAGQ